MSISAQKKAKEYAQEIGALAEEALQVQPKIVEGIEDAAIAAGKSAFEQVQASLELGKEIASLAKESTQIDFESMEKESREGVAAYLGEAAQAYVTAGEEHEKRTGDSSVTEAGRLMQSCLEEYANTGKAEKLEAAQMLSDYAGVALIGRDNVSGSLKSVHKLLKLSPYKIAKAEAETRKLFGQTRKELFIASINAQAESLKAQAERAIEVADNYRKEAKKPGNAQYVQEYNLQVEENRNRAMLLKASRAMLLKAGEIGPKAQGKAGKEQRDAEYLLGKAGQFAAIANGSQSLVSHGGENPAQALSREAGAIAKSPEIVLSEEKGYQYELLAARSLMQVRAQRNMHFSDSLMREAPKSGLDAKQRKEIEGWLSKAVELSDSAQAEISPAGAGAEGAKRAYSLVGASEYYLDAAREMLYASRALREEGLGGRDMKAAQRHLSGAMEMHSQAGQKLASGALTEGERGEMLTEAGSEAAQRAGILARETLVFAQMAAAGKRMEEEGGEEPLLRFKAAMKQMENGLERIAEGEELDAALKSMEGAEGRVAHAMRESRLAAYAKSLKKHKGNEYLSEMRAVGERAGEVLSGGGKWAKFGAQERFALFDEIISAGIAHEHREERLRRFRKRTGSFAQKKEYTKLLNLAADAAEEILHGKGEWAQEDAGTAAARFREIMGEAEKYVAYFLPSTYATGAKGREDGREIRGQGLAAAERDLKERSGQKLLPSELCRKHQGMVLRGILNPKEKIDVEAERKKVAIYAQAMDRLYLGLASVGNEVNRQKMSMVLGQKRAREIPHMRGGAGTYQLSEAARKADEALDEAGARSRLREYAGAAVRSSLKPNAKNLRDMENARWAVYDSLGTASGQVRKKKLASIGVSEAEKVAGQLAQERMALDEGERLARSLEMEMHKHPQGSRERGSIGAAIHVLKRKMERGKDRIAALEGAYIRIGKEMGQGLEAEDAARVSRLEREKEKMELKLAAMEERVETLAQQSELDDARIRAASVMGIYGGEAGNEEKRELARAMDHRNSLALSLRRVDEELGAYGGIRMKEGEVRDEKRMEGALDEADRLLAESSRELAQAELAALAAGQAYSASANITAERHMGILRGISMAAPQRESSSRNAIDKASKAVVLLEYGGKRFGGSESAAARVKEMGEKAREGRSVPSGDSERAFEEYREAARQVQASNAATEAKANPEDAEFGAHKNENRLLMDSWRNVREREEMERPSWRAGAGEEAQYSQRYLDNLKEGEKNKAGMMVLETAEEVWRGASGGVGDSEIPAALAKKKLDEVLGNMDSMSAGQIAASVDSIERNLEQVKQGNEVSKWMELSTLPLDFTPGIGLASIIAKMGGGMLEGYAQTGQGPDAMGIISLAAITSSRLGGLSSMINASRVYRATQIAAPIYFTAHSAMGFSETFRVWRKTGYLDPTMIQEAAFMLAPVVHMVPAKEVLAFRKRARAAGKKGPSAREREYAERERGRGTGDSGQFRFIREEGRARDMAEAFAEMNGRAERETGTGRRGRGTMGKRGEEANLKKSKSKEQAEKKSIQRRLLTDEYTAYYARISRGWETPEAELNKLVWNSLEHVGINPKEPGRVEAILSEIPSYLNASQKGAEAVYRVARLAKISSPSSTFVKIHRLRYRGYKQWLQTPEGQEYTRTRSFYVGKENAEGVVREVARERKVEPGKEAEFLEKEGISMDGGSINMEVGTESLIAGLNISMMKLAKELEMETGEGSHIASIRTDLSNTGLVNNTGTNGRSTGNLYMGADYMLPLGVEVPQKINDRLLGEPGGKPIEAVAIAANTAKLNDEITIRIIAADKESMEAALKITSEILNEQATNSKHFQSSVEKANALVPGTFAGNAYFRYGIAVGKMGKGTAKKKFEQLDNAADEVASIAAKKLSAAEAEGKTIRKPVPAGIAVEGGVDLETRELDLQKVKMPKEEAQDVSILNEKYKGKAPKRGEYMHNEDPETGGIPWAELVDDSTDFLAVKLTQHIQNKPLRTKIVKAAEKSGKAYSHARKAELTLTGANAIHSGLGDEVVSVTNFAMKLAENSLNEAVKNMGMRDANGNLPKIGNGRDADIMLIQRGNNPTLQIWFRSSFMKFNKGKPLNPKVREGLAREMWRTMKEAENEGTTYYDPAKIEIGASVISSGAGFERLSGRRKRDIAAGMIRHVQDGKVLIETRGHSRFENFSRERDLMEDTATPVNRMLEFLGSEESGTFEERVHKRVAKEYQEEVLESYRGVFGRRHLGIILDNIGKGKKYRVRELADLEYALEEMANEGKFGKNGDKYVQGVMVRLRETAEGSPAQRIRKLHEFEVNRAPGEPLETAKAAAGGR